jgi:hypothetical protein
VASSTSRLSTCRRISERGGAAGRSCGLGRVRSDALLGEVADGGRREAGAEARQGVDRRGGVAAPVPSEAELVEIALQVRADRPCGAAASRSRRSPPRPRAGCVPDRPGRGAASSAARRSCRCRAPAGPAVTAPRGRCNGW